MNNTVLSEIYQKALSRTPHSGPGVTPQQLGRHSRLVHPYPHYVRLRLRHWVCYFNRTGKAAALSIYNLSPVPGLRGWLPSAPEVVPCNLQLALAARRQKAY